MRNLWQNLAGLRSWIRNLAPYGVFFAVFVAVLQLLPDLNPAWTGYMLSVLSGLSAALIVALASQERESGGASHSVGDEKFEERHQAIVVGRQVESLLLERLQHRRTESGEVILGWTHFLDPDRLDEQPVSALSTAYGVKALLLARHRPGSKVDFAVLRETLWSLSLENWLWAASSRPETPRPEVSSIVVGALGMAGENRSRLVESSRRILDLLSEEQDPVGAWNTYVVSTVLRNIGTVLPDDVRVEVLARRLVDGAVWTDAGSCAHWKEGLDSRAESESISNTAQALYALSFFSHARPDCKWVDRPIEGAIQYLSTCTSNDSFRLETEQIVRPDPRGQDILVVRHFTAAWVLRALLFAGSMPDEAAVRTARDIVLEWRPTASGAWVWSDGTSPIWMSYQGALALMSFVERMSVMS